VAHEFVTNVGNAWSWTMDELARYFESIQAHAPDQALSAFATPLELVDRELPPLAEETIGAYLYWAELLGRRVGELHSALAATSGGVAFAPEPFTRLYQRGLYQSLRSQARATLELLRSRLNRLNEGTQRLADWVLDRESTILARYAELLPHPIVARRIRCHGDLHLGHALFTGKDFTLIGFEGAPGRPVSERRIKASPLRDIASMLMSFHDAAHAALRGQPAAVLTQHGSAPVEQWAAFWSAWVSANFLRAYLSEAAPAGFLPAHRAHLQTLLGCYMPEKALDKLRYALMDLTGSVGVPLQAILQEVDANVVLPPIQDQRKIGSDCPWPDKAPDC
jgi:maltose alpha-D-glucosyltransferase/alpha-amylase